MGSYGLIAAYILTGAGGNLLSTLYNWLKFHTVNVFPGGAGASGAVFGIAGCTHRVAQVETVARASTGSAKTAQVSHLFRSD